MKEEKVKTEKSQKKEKPVSITVKANKKGRHVMKLLSVLRVIVVPIYYLFKPFRYFGQRKVKDGACVYISNHYTLFDPVYIVSTTWEGVHFVCKKEVAEKPVLGGIARGVKTIFANRDGNDIRTMLDCLKCLKNGEKVAIYPEGTRNRTEEEILPFKHGAAAMAIKTKTPIVPVVMYNKPRLFRCTHILIGSSFELSEYYDKKLSENDYVEADEKLRQIMLDMRHEHKEYLENKEMNKKRNKKR